MSFTFYKAFFSHQKYISGAVILAHHLATSKVGERH